MTTTPQPGKGTSVLLEILGILGIAANSASAVLTGPAAAADQLAVSLITIAQKAILAHELQTGQPIDPTLLKPWEPLP